MIKLKVEYTLCRKCKGCDDDCPTCLGFGMQPEDDAYKSIATMKVYLKRHARQAKDIKVGDCVLTGGTNFSMVVDVTPTDKYRVPMIELKLVEGARWYLRSNAMVLRKPSQDQYEKEMVPLIERLPGITLIQDK